MVNYNDLFSGIRYDDETSYGSGSVSGDALSLGRVTSFSLSVSDDKGRHLGIGEGRNDSSYTYGPVNVSFSLNWDVLSCAVTPARSNSLDFLKYVVGGVSGSGTSGDPYLITEADYFGYTAATNILTFAIWNQTEGGTIDDQDQYVGCFLNTVTLTAAVDTILTASASATAQKITSAATIANAYVKDTNPPLVFQQGSFKWGATPTAVALVQNFSLTVNGNTITSREIGTAGRFIAAVTAGRIQYEWSLTARMTDTIATTLRDDFYGQANSFIAGTVDAEVAADKEIELQFSEGSATDDRVVTIALDQCTITSMNKSVAIGNGFVDVTFSGWAKRAKGNNLVSYHVV